jgi:hypothetical protein
VGEETWAKIKLLGLDFVHAAINHGWMQSKGVTGVLWMECSVWWGCLFSCNKWDGAGGTHLVLVPCLSHTLLLSAIHLISHSYSLGPMGGLEWAGDLLLVFGCGRQRQGKHKDLVHLIAFWTYGVYKSTSFYQVHTIFHRPPKIMNILLWILHIVSNIDTFIFIFYNVSQETYVDPCRSCHC